MHIYVHDHLMGVVNKTKTDSSQWYPLTGQEATGPDRNAGITFKRKGGVFFYFCFVTVFKL